MSLRKDVGSLLIVGLSGTSLSSMEAAWLRMIAPAGVILFRRNIEAAEEVRELLKNASAYTSAPLFRCVDVEGGLVDRLRDLIVPMPSAAAVASAGKTKLALQHGRLIGEELALLGLNTTFAPVLDLALPLSAGVMRTRVAGRTPAEVVAYAASFLQGLRKAGVIGCGKHFPGLGGGALDSHAAMPEIDRDWKQLWNEDVMPYRKLLRRLPFVMVAHAAYPRVEKSQGPASLSRYWITDVLKKKLGYRGLVLSDDMEMGGVLGQQSMAEAAVAAIVAGTHLLEICKEPALILEAYEALLAEAEKSRAFRRTIERAAVHVAKQKWRLLSDLKASTMTAPPEQLKLQVEGMRGCVQRFADDVQRTIDAQQAKRQKA